MFYDDFRRQRPANAVVIHVGCSSFYDAFADDALKVNEALNIGRIGAITWNGQKIPVLERSSYSLEQDAAALIEAGCQVFICRRIAGVYHYEPFQPASAALPPSDNQHPVPPPGYTLIKGKLGDCPVCGRDKNRWFGPDKERIFQDDQAQAMWRKVEEDRDDWGWLSSLLVQCGFTSEHIWRLMGSAPMWSDRQYYLGGVSLARHWSRYSVGGCECGVAFWHDWGRPMRYYVKIPAQPKLPNPRQQTPPQEQSGQQMTLF